MWFFLSVSAVGFLSAILLSHFYKKNGAIAKYLYGLSAVGVIAAFVVRYGFKSLVPFDLTLAGTAIVLLSVFVGSLVKFFLKRRGKDISRVDMWAARAAIPGFILFAIGALGEFLLHGPS
jgi:hypothetical protein